RILPAQERIALAIGTVGDVVEMTRPVNYRSIRPVGSDDLFGIIGEGVDVERYAIIEDAIAGAKDRLLVGEWSPRQPGARRDAEGFGDPLPLHAQAEIEGQFRRHNPVILAEADQFEVFAIERMAAREFDPSQAIALRIQDVDGPGDKFAFV